MMNLFDQPFVDETGKMIPLSNYDIKCMSMGFLIRKSEDALVWRGPMVMGALEKLAHGTNWVGTDIVVIDMPPGTGDIHLSVAQTLAVKGAIVVSSLSWNQRWHGRGGEFTALPTGWSMGTPPKKIKLLYKTD